MSQDSTPIMTRYDLHSHTNASDGELPPAELVERAIAMGVNILSITDHDTCDGLIAAKAYLTDNPRPLTLVNGVEISTLWENIEIHIVGLNFSPSHPAMETLLTQQSQRRLERGIEIGRRLQKAGIEDAWENAQAMSGGGQLLAPILRSILSKLAKRKPSIMCLSAIWRKEKPAMCQRSGAASKKLWMPFINLAV